MLAPLGGAGYNGRIRVIASLNDLRILHPSEISKIQLRQAASASVRSDRPLF